MKRTIPTFVGGVAIGAASVYFALSFRSDFEAETEAAQLSGEEAELRGKVRSLEAEVSRLEGQLAARAAPAEKGRGPEILVFGGDGESPSPEEMEKRMMPHWKRFAEQQVSRYSMQLDLSAEQKQKLQDLLLLKQQRFHEMMMTGRQGAKGANPLSELIKDSEVLDVARGFMSEEQVATFARIQEDERKARNEMMATARLGDIAPVLGLDEAQKDALFGLYYSEAEQMEDGVFTPPPDGTGTSEREAALKEILTPEQMERYRELQEERKQRGGMFFIGG